MCKYCTYKVCVCLTNNHHSQYPFSTLVGIILENFDHLNSLSDFMLELMKLSYKFDSTILISWVTMMRMIFTVSAVFQLCLGLIVQQILANCVQIMISNNLPVEVHITK